VKLVKGKKPPISNGTPKPATAKPAPARPAPARPAPAKPATVRPGSSKPSPKKTGARGLEEDVALLTLEERADKTLDRMNDIDAFEWAVGDSAKTIGLNGCTVIALYNDKAIVWGHYSPVMSENGVITMDHQQTLNLAFSRIEAEARAKGILGGTQRAKGVVRVDIRAASLKPPPGVPNIPQIIFNWFNRLQVSQSDRGIYDGQKITGTCTIEHATTAGGNVKVTMI
jgi:hypothetical protein